MSAASERPLRDLPVAPRIERTSDALSFVDAGGRRWRVYDIVGAAGGPHEWQGWAPPGPRGCAHRLFCGENGTERLYRFRRQEHRGVSVPRLTEQLDAAEKTERTR